MHGGTEQFPLPASTETLTLRAIQKDAQRPDRAKFHGRFGQQPSYDYGMQTLEQYYLAIDFPSCVDVTRMGLLIIGRNQGAAITNYLS